MAVGVGVGVAVAVVVGVGVGVAVAVVVGVVVGVGVGVVVGVVVVMLNPDQLAAVNAGPGAWCCLASAGAGKTRVLVERYKRLIAEGEDPEEILCLTFTRKAAGEMRDRIGMQSVFGRSGFRTFHSLAYKFYLREGTLPLDFEIRLDVLIPLMIEKLKSNRARRKYWTFKWIMVDEANDLTLEQVELLQLLSAGYGNVFLVGDTNQAIFSFAGSTPEPMIHFERYFPGGRYLTLGVNYRSTKKIVELCRRLAPIQTELLERLTTDNEEGETPTFTQYEDNQEELAGAIVEVALFKDSDCMVLARTNRQLKDLIAWGGVPTMTIHKSKGLQWDNVWVIGCQDGLLPLTGADEEEEARLLFVAASRAAKTLHFSSYGAPSKFIQKFLAEGLIKEIR